MNNTPARKPRSALLEQLPADVMARLRPDLQRVDLMPGEVLCKAGVVPSHVYFPCSGLVSLCYLTSNGDAGEIATVGSEGVVGVTRLLGGGGDAIRAVAQTPGTALSLKAEAGIREFQRHGAFQSLVLQYMTWLFAQISQAAVCNRHHSIEQQLSRWLLAGFDRIEESQIRITHEALANLLGVRREGITEAAGRLQDAGGIRYGRGSIRLVDRGQLEQHACECYPLLKPTYTRPDPAATAGAQP
jgi:CRP-like cAMP-binding protein